MAGWAGVVERERERYEDGLERLPHDRDARQKQLVRVANAAWGAGLAELMRARHDEGRDWLLRSAERYRESIEDAPEGSWGRPIGAMKTRLIAGDVEGAERDARWALELGAGESASPIGRYAAAIAHLVLGEDGDAAGLASGLLAEDPDRFPEAVASALLGLATSDGPGYADGLERTLRSFEERDEYLEDVPVADTVMVLEALARPRGLARDPKSPLLPPA